MNSRSVSAYGVVRIGRQPDYYCGTSSPDAARGRGRCGRESSRSSYPSAFRVDYQPTRGYIRHTARIGSLLRTTRTREGKSTRRIAAAAFRLRDANGLAYAPTADIRRRRSEFGRPASNRALPMCSAGADLRRTPTRIRLKSNEAIPRREFAPRDPCLRNQLCRCLPRWRALEPGTTRGGPDRAGAE